MKNPLDTLSETELRQHINGTEPLPLQVVAAIAEHAAQGEINRRNLTREVQSAGGNGQVVPLLRAIC